MNSSKIYILPDVQIKPGVKNSLIPAAWDIINELPDYVVNLGDTWDMPSLSGYDRDKHSFIERCYIEDIEAGNTAMEEFWAIIELGRIENPDWQCKFIFCAGNHEQRVNKAKENGPSSYLGLLEMVTFDLTHWDVVMPFLEPYTINGVSFVHYLANEFSGRAISSAQQGLNKKGQSFVVGHKQTFDYAESIGINGKRRIGVIAGACYLHDEEYKGPQSNNHFRGTLILRNVAQGEFDIETRSLKHLIKKYPGCL